MPLGAMVPSTHALMAVQIQRCVDGSLQKEVVFGLCRLNVRQHQEKIDVFNGLKHL